MEVAQLQKAEECIFTGMKVLGELKMKPIHSFGFLFLGELYAYAGRKEESLKKSKTGRISIPRDGNKLLVRQDKENLRNFKNVKKVPTSRQHK